MYYKRNSYILNSSRASRTFMQLINAALADYNTSICNPKNKRHVFIITKDFFSQFYDIALFRSIK